MTRTPRYHKPLALMSPEEAYGHLQRLKEQLVRKQQREQAYLDRRAHRGTHTPTDDAYEADQVLEDELLALLEQLIEEARNLREAP